MSFTVLECSLIGVKEDVKCKLRECIKILLENGLFCQMDFYSRGLKLSHILGTKGIAFGDVLTLVPIINQNLEDLQVIFNSE